MTIRYENIVVTDVESAGRLVFALVTSEPAAESFTVQVCTRELNDTLATGPESDGFATGKYHICSNIDTQPTTHTYMHTHNHTHVATYMHAVACILEYTHCCLLFS